MQNQNAQHRKAKRGTYNRQIFVLVRLPRQESCCDTKNTVCCSTPSQKYHPKTLTYHRRFGIRAREHQCQHRVCARKMNPHGRVFTSTQATKCLQVVLGLRLALLSPGLHHQSQPTPGIQASSAPHRQHHSHLTAQPSISCMALLRSEPQGNPTGSADPTSLPPSALGEEKTQKSSWSALERMVFLLPYL